MSSFDPNKKPIPNLKVGDWVIFPQFGVPKKVVEIVDEGPTTCGAQRFKINGIAVDRYNNGDWILAKPEERSALGPLFDGAKDEA